MPVHASGGSLAAVRTGSQNRNQAAQCLDATPITPAFDPSVQGVVVRSAITVLPAGEGAAGFFAHPESLRMWAKNWSPRDTPTSLRLTR